MHFLGFLPYFSKNGNVEKKEIFMKSMERNISIENIIDYNNV